MSAVGRGESAVVHDAQPDYACAILHDAEGRLLLERRPTTARFAAGLLTCPGGRREAGEEARACLRRELDEELGWRPQRFRRAVDLFVEGRWIARFYHVASAAVDLRPTVAVEAWAVDRLPPEQVSPWHAAVLTAWRAGRRRVELGRSGPV